MKDLTTLEKLFLQWIDNHDGWKIGDTTQTCYADETDFNVFHIRLNYDRIGTKQLAKIKRTFDKYIIGKYNLDMTKVILRSRSGTDQARIKDSFVAWFILQRLENPFSTTSTKYRWEDDTNTLHIKLKAIPQ